MIDIPDLLKSTQIGIDNGISIQDVHIHSWLKIKDVISSDEERTIQRAKIKKGPHIILKSSGNKESLFYEYLVGRRVNQLSRYTNSFVTTFGIFSKDNMTHLILEYVPGVNLNTYLSTKGPSCYFDIFKQVIKALKIGQEIISFTHYDLHFGNIIVNDGRIKIIDFGYSHAYLGTYDKLKISTRVSGYERGVSPSVMDPLYDIVYFIKTFYSFLNKFRTDNSRFGSFLNSISKKLIDDNGFVPITSRRVCEIDIPLVFPHSKDYMIYLRNVERLTLKEAIRSSRKRQEYIDNKSGDNYFCSDNDIFNAEIINGYKLTEIQERRGMTFEEFYRLIEKLDKPNRSLINS